MVMTRSMDKGLKSPNSPHPVCFVLIADALVATVEVLVPRFYSAVLGRTPIGDAFKKNAHKAFL